MKGYIMKFKYNDRVKVKDEFYGEVSGRVKDYVYSFKSIWGFKSEYKYIVMLDSSNQIEWFWESQLERIEEK